MFVRSLLVGIATLAVAAPAFAGDQAFVYAGKERAQAYVAKDAYTHNPAGAVEITRKGPGLYAVRMRGMGTQARGGNAQVSAYGGRPAFCSVERWVPSGGDLEMIVRCFNMRGQPADSKFTALFTAKASGNKPVRFAWAGRPKSPNYTLEAGYSQNGGQPVQAKRTAPGRYQLTFSGVSARDARGGNVQVSSYGAGPNFCSVVRWVSQANGMQVNVHCYRAGGAPADSAFTVLFTPGR